MSKTELSGTGNNLVCSPPLSQHTYIYVARSKSKNSSVFGRPSCLKKLRSLRGLWCKMPYNKEQSSKPHRWKGDESCEFCEGEKIVEHLFSARCTIAKYILSVIAFMLGVKCRPGATLGLDKSEPTKRKTSLHYGFCSSLMGYLVHKELCLLWE